MANPALKPLETPSRDTQRIPPLAIPKRPIQEEGGEGWLISYADLMTLMFGFFVLVAAFSTPDAEKIEKMKKMIQSSVDQPYNEPNEELTQSLTQVLQDFQLQDDVKIVSTEEGISLTSRGTVFFDSASAELKPEAQDLMERVADVLVDKAKGFRVIVEGHTDDVPIHTGKFASNWELSASRASTVVRLIESRGFPHNRLRPLGFADVEPSLPNYDRKTGKANEENRARNRRIVIRLQKHLERRMPPEPPN